MYYNVYAVQNTRRKKTQYHLQFYFLQLTNDRFDEIRPSSTNSFIIIFFRRCFLFCSFIRSFVLIVQSISFSSHFFRSFIKQFRCVIYFSSIHSTWFVFCCFCYVVAIAYILLLLLLWAIALAVVILLKCFVLSFALINDFCVLYFEWADFPQFLWTNVSTIGYRKLRIVSFDTLVQSLLVIMACHLHFRSRYFTSIVIIMHLKCVATIVSSSEFRYRNGIWIKTFFSIFLTTFGLRQGLCVPVIIYKLCVRFREF